MQCPRCAQIVPAGAASCSRCGTPLAAVSADRTLHVQPMGGARPAPTVDDVAATMVWQKGQAAQNAGTPAPGAIRGSSEGQGGSLDATAVANLGATDAADMMAATTASGPPVFDDEGSPGSIASSAKTIVGVARVDGVGVPAARATDPRPAPKPATAARTLVGVAMPGSGFQPRKVDETLRNAPPKAAPSSPGGSATLPQRVMGGAKEGPSAGPVPAPPARAPREARPAKSPGEMAASSPLGARKIAGVNSPYSNKKRHPLDKRVVVAAAQKKSKADATNRTAILAIAAALAALVAIFVVLLWSGRGPLIAHPRVDAEGGDGLDLECASCPDATVVRLGSATASMIGHRTFLPVSLPLGESKLDVTIDRPGSAKDEVVKVVVQMPYRVTTDLKTLHSERPAIQVVVEAQVGTKVVLDGKDVPLVNGRAIDMLDVTDACGGESDEPRTLSRKIPYVITPSGGSAEQGSLLVSVPITPLRIQSPGPSVITEKESFVLAGRTGKGADLFAGPHAIPVEPGGAFAHVMNVSSVGATQIAVRAQAQGMAPRIVKIDVRRVESLEATARELASRSPLTLPDLRSDTKTKVGKEALVSGLVLTTRSVEHVTVLKLRGVGGPACPPLPIGARPETVGDVGACAVEIAIGGTVPYAPGDLVTGCGRFAGTTGAPGSEVPQVRADFVLKGVL